MNVSEAQQALDTLKAELATLPAAIKAAVQGMRAGEVRRLRERQTEIEDELLAAEMAVVDAELAALPGAQELARRGRQAQEQLKLAEAEHQRAIEKLIAARELYRADLAVSIGAQQARDRLLRSKTELELRLAAASGEKVFVDMAGRRVPDPSTIDESKIVHKQPTVSPFIMSSERHKEQEPETKRKFRPGSRA